MNYEDRYTPRHRTLDQEVAEEYAELFKTAPASWELFYSDGSRVSGTTQEEWNAAPDDDVQILIWKTVENIVHQVYGSDEYILGGVVKYGKWMHDPTYYRMQDEIGIRSSILKGEF